MTASNVGMDAGLHRTVLPVTELPLFAAVYEGEEPPKIAPAREPEPWCFIASQEGPVFDELVRIARRFAERNGSRGVTVGEVVYEYERTGRRHGGVPMENKTLEQRQTSWNPRIMPAAGLVASDAKPRPSPVKRHHKHKHTVWVLPEFAA